MKKRLFVCALGLASQPLWANNSIEELSVNGELVTFTTSQSKVSSNPACVTSPNEELWSVSLSHNVGRAMYAMLVAASNNKQSITVTSAGDCADAQGIERVAAIKVSATQAAVQPSSGSGVFLYKGDGITKIGTVVNAVNNSAVYYVPSSESSSATNVNLSAYTVAAKLPNTFVMIYSGDNCTGNVQSITPNLNGWHPNYANGKFIKSSPSRSGFSARSKKLLHNNTCYEYVISDSWYNVTFSTDPVCGDSPCIFKDH